MRKDEENREWVCAILLRCLFSFNYFLHLLNHLLLPSLPPLFFFYLSSVFFILKDQIKSQKYFYSLFITSSFSSCLLIVYFTFTFINDFFSFLISSFYLSFPSIFIFLFPFFSIFLFLLLFFVFFFIFYYFFILTHSHRNHAISI